MTKKRILNVTSRKKKDTMLTTSNTSNTGAQQTIAVGSGYVAGNNAGYFLWAATARDLIPGTGGTLAAISNEANRTATTCFMRGLSEHVRIQTSSGLLWFHRRICFTYKGDDPFNTGFSDVGANQLFSETSNGTSRLFFNNNINNTPNFQNNAHSTLFRGTQGNDWNDILTATVDTRRVTLKFDKTWTMQSGNAQGLVRERKLWHPMNKNLVYDDDESALGETTNNFSVGGKQGMGDYYVYDIIIPGTGGTASDLLQINSSSTLYWHEK